MWSSFKKQVDIAIRFGITNFIDRRDDKAYCLLCFVEFDHDNCDDHINSEFHQTLLKVSEKLKDGESIEKASKDLCDLDISNKVLKEINLKHGDDQMKSFCGDESELPSTHSNHFEDVKPSTSAKEQINEQVICGLFVHTVMKEMEKQHEKKIREELFNSAPVDDQLAEGKSESNNTQSNDFEDVKPLTSVVEENIDLKDYAKQNGIRYNKQNKEAVCELCNVQLSGNIKNITEHVNGGIHKKMKVKKDGKTTYDCLSYKTTPWNEFEESVGMVEDGPELVGFFFNTKFYITRDSFMLLRKVNHLPHYFCVPCQKVVPDTEGHIHMDTSPHSGYMRSPVVQMENELIREINPRILFHCGFCNEFYNWIIMKHHVTTIYHRIAREKSEHLARRMRNSARETGIDIEDDLFSIKLRR